MRAAVRFAVVVPVLAAMGFGSAAAVNLALADDAVLEASREMGAWTAAGSRPAQGTWESVHAKLEQARARTPADPTTQELLGILMSQGAGKPETVDAGPAHFVNALRARPTSPYTWANLVEADYRQGNTGPRFLFALQQAAALGPSEPEVQRMVADHGLAVWDEVGAEPRQTIDRMVRAGLRRKPLEMLQISERRGRLAVACRHLVGLDRAPDPKWYQLCQSTEITP